MEQTHTLGFEKFYDEEGNLLQETVLDTKEYQSRVQTFNIEKNHHENSIKLQNIHTINKYTLSTIIPELIVSSFYFIDSK